LETKDFWDRRQKPPTSKDRKKTETHPRKIRGDVEKPRNEFLRCSKTTTMEEDPHILKAVATRKRPDGADDHAS
jgi:hypothetical protein